MRRKWTPSFKTINLLCLIFHIFPIVVPELWVLFFLWAQDTLDELKLVTGGTLAEVGNLQDCFLQQIEPVPQYTGKAWDWELKLFLMISKEANVMNIENLKSSNNNYLTEL